MKTITMKHGKPWMPNAVNSVFYVNNDAKGQKFLKELRTHLNGANYKIRLEGRNPDRQQFRDDKKGWRGNQHRLRSALRNNESTYFAVYVDQTGKKKEIESESASRSWDRSDKLQEEVNRLRRYSENLEQEVAQLQQKLVDNRVETLPGWGRKIKFEDLPS
jgi:hypothetical protein